MGAIGRQPDAMDERLLAMLEQNARRPVAALAKAVGLSRSAVQERLARLEDDGTIAAYTIVRGARPRQEPVRAVLLLSIDTRPCDAVIRLFRGWSEVKACYSVAGGIDAVLLVETASNEALGELRIRLAAVSGITGVTTAPILRTIVERAPRPAGSCPDSRRKPHDGNDAAILPG